MITPHGLLNSDGEETNEENLPIHTHFNSVPAQNYDDKFTWVYRDANGGKIELAVSLINFPSTNSAGFYSIKSLPIGSWTIHAWSEHTDGEDAKEVTFTGDNAIEVNFVLK